MYCNGGISAGRQVEAIRSPLAGGAYKRRGQNTAIDPFRKHNSLKFKNTASAGLAEAHIYPFNQNVNPMHTALLIIDVQRALFEVEPQPFEADIVVQRINALSERARTLSIPVVFVQHEKEGTPLDFQSEGWQLQKNIVTSTGDLFVRKTTPDAFLGTQLEQIFNEFGVKHVVVCGYASEFCVDTTVRRAAALGYSVTLVADTHTTCDKPHAGGAAIRAHENATLPNITSFGPVIQAILSKNIAFASIKQDVRGPAVFPSTPATTA